MFNSKPFLGMFFLGFLVWVASIFVAGEPLKRIDRTCAPVNWTNTFFGSVVQLVAPSYVPKVDSFFNARFMDCRFLVWNQFYEKDYQQMKRDSVEGAAK